MSAELVTLSPLDQISSGRDAPPVAVGRAPGRVNIIGDHVDYCGGLVMPMALPHACYAAALRGDVPDGVCRLSSTAQDGFLDFPTGAPIEPGVHCEIGTWASYMLGSIAELQDTCDLSKLSGHEIRIHSEVPLGAGLSSSASLEVSVAITAAAVMGVEIGGLDLARRCQRAEHRFAGMPCGLMDQAASVLGEDGHAVLLDCASETPSMIRVPQKASFVIIDSGVTHELADGAYAKRRAACEEARDLLGVRHLAAADPGSLGSLQEELLPFARHVVGETDRVRRAADAFQRGQLGEVGRLMLESHESLRDDFRVSCPEIDAIVDRLRAVECVLGVRMTGGGFGGSVVALVGSGDEAAVIAAAEGCRDVAPRLATMAVRPSEGAKLLG